MQVNDYFISLGIKSSVYLLFYFGNINQISWVLTKHLILHNSKQIYLVSSKQPNSQMEEMLKGKYLDEIEFLNKEK